MPRSRRQPRIGLQAARAAIEWTHLFAQELNAAARQAAKDADLITVEHYRQALPIASAKVLEATESYQVESANARSRAG
jgi:hypothetical protein